jgi:hypothetical protein
MYLFRELNGYLPQVIVVHMNPALESEIANELDVVSNALSCKITLAYEGQEVDVQHRVAMHVC